MCVADERALVAGAASFGWVFATRTPAGVSLRVRAPPSPAAPRYDVLHVLAFTSARKRMSVIVRAPSGECASYPGLDVAACDIHFVLNYSMVSQVKLNYSAREQIQ